MDRQTYRQMDGSTDILTEMGTSGNRWTDRLTDRQTDRHNTKLGLEDMQNVRCVIGQDKFTHLNH